MRVFYPQTGAPCACAGSETGTKPARICGRPAAEIFLQIRGTCLVVFRRQWRHDVGTAPHRRTAARVNPAQTTPHSTSLQRFHWWRCYRCCSCSCYDIFTGSGAARPCSANRALLHLIYCRILCRSILTTPPPNCVCYTVGLGWRFAISVRKKEFTVGL